MSPLRRSRLSHPQSRSWSAQPGWGTLLGRTPSCCNGEWGTATSKDPPRAAPSCCCRVLGVNRTPLGAASNHCQGSMGPCPVPVLLAEFWEASLQPQSTGRAATSTSAFTQRHPHGKPRRYSPALLCLHPTLLQHGPKRDPSTRGVPSPRTPLPAAAHCITWLGRQDASHHPARPQGSGSSSCQCALRECCLCVPRWGHTARGAAGRWGGSELHNAANCPKRSSLGEATAQSAPLVRATAGRWEKS